MFLSKNSTIKNIVIGTAIIGATSLTIASIYKLYKYFKETSNVNKPVELSEFDIAKLLSEITELSSQMNEEENKDLISQRIKAIDDNERYDQLCLESIVLEQNSFIKVATIVLEKKKMGFDFNHLISLVNNVNPDKLSELSCQCLQLSKEEEVIEPDKAKEGLLFYLEMLYNTINTKKQILIGEIMNQETIQQQLSNITLISKKKADDYLLIKYGFKETVLRTILYRNGLLNDKDIIAIENKIKAI